MSLGLSQAMSMRQEQAQRIPSPGVIAMNSMGIEEMEELALEMVDLARSGIFKGNSDVQGNLIDSPLFSGVAGGIVKRRGDRSPEYSITSDLVLQSLAGEVRQRIEKCLKALTRKDPAKPHEVFSKRFLGEFDWITKTREKLVLHAVQHQKDFVQKPYDPLLLKDLTYEKLSGVIKYHQSTVSRIMKDLLIEFPDSFVREFAILVPGYSLTPLQGRYLVALLSQESHYYDTLNGWKISEEETARILSERYSFNVKRRAVSNYRRWVDRHLLKTRRNPDVHIADDGGGDGESEDEIA